MLKENTGAVYFSICLVIVINNSCFSLSGSRQAGLSAYNHAVINGAILTLVLCIKENRCSLGLEAIGNTKLA